MIGITTTVMTTVFGGVDSVSMMLSEKNSGV
jgi:hypothetical protein